MEKLIITLAPTGNVPTKEMNPAVPITPSEIIEDIKKCEAIGVSLAHMHVRDENSMPTSSYEKYRELNELFNASGLKVIKQFSTGARGGENTYEYRAQMLPLRPEMASLSTGSSNFPTSINGNSPDLIASLADDMKKYGIKPEIEVFDLSMIDNAVHLHKKGVLTGNLHFNMVMNVPGSVKGTMKNLMYLIDALPNGSTFTVSGIGKSQTKMLATSILMGGHVRTGLEDIVKLGGVNTSNEELVKNVLKIASALGREIATPDEAREILGL